MKGYNAWKLLFDSLETGIPAVLLFVLESRGSSPGRQGFFMAVNAEGSMQGSIGGGIMEHKFVEMAREKLREAGLDAQVRKQVHDRSAGRDRSGMICSGEQTVFIYPLQEKDRDAVDNILRTLEKNQSGTLHLSPEGIGFSNHDAAPDFYFQMNAPDDWQYRQRLGFQHKIFIVGGGHCALALSRLMRSLDFYIHVFDEREGLNTMEQNEFAHSKQVIGSYADLGGQIPSGRNHYVVIMTFGYRTDTVALKAVCRNSYRYLGLMGSKKKIETMFAELEAEGLDKSVLARVHAPIGLPIKSETPEEIAVSIAAEIIRIKNEGMASEEKSPG